MPKFCTTLLAAFAFTTVASLSGCASKGEGEASMTWTERWKAMRERQDAAAAATVATDSGPSASDNSPSAAQARW